MAFELTDANFKEEVLDKSGVAVVDFWAEWCGPCRMIGPIIEELSNDYEGKALVGKVDVDANSEVSMKYGIRSIPTILILKDGEVVDQQVGVATKQALAEKIEKYLVAA
ncbi:thioredoxin [Lewinellaceae bacterium SD302]|nr:thioredoxin [Lewinellaceae bacterium SD302]